MIERIVIMRSQNKALIIYTDRDPVTIWPGDKQIDEFMMWYLTERKDFWMSIPDRVHNSDIEVTEVIAVA